MIIAIKQLKKTDLPTPIFRHHLKLMKKVKLSPFNFKHIHIVDINMTVKLLILLCLTLFS